MSELPVFALTVSQNEFLSVDATQALAVIKVVVRDPVESWRELGTPTAEVIAVDCSGSMGHPTTKISAARHATATAIDALRDGVFFAVVRGTEDATMVYPNGGRNELVAATAQTRRAAKEAVRHLDAAGGTAMGEWLRLADSLLTPFPTALRHVMLLTDGRNLPLHRDDLDEALEMCAGRFVCDGRGIGDDYAPDELQRIVSTLNGSADAIVHDSDLAAEFRAIMGTAMGKVVPDVWLRFQPTTFARLRFVKQMFPVENDLTQRGKPVGEHAIAFSTGSWSAAEEREFLVCFDVARGDRTMDVDWQAAKVDVTIMPGGGTQAQPCGDEVPIVVHWTPDPTRSTVVDAKVAHYTGQSELAAAVTAGVDAFNNGDLTAAAAAWGRAVALAVRAGNAELFDRLAEIVHIDGDPAAGSVRVKENLRPREIFSVVFGSQRRTIGPDEQTGRPPARPAVTDHRCPQCDFPRELADRFCVNCRHRLDEIV